MYPHSALIGGGTPLYYPNEHARPQTSTEMALRGATRLGLLASLASILSWRGGGERSGGRVTVTGGSAGKAVGPQTVVLPRTLESSEMDRAAAS